MVGVPEFKLQGEIAIQERSSTKSMVLHKKLRLQISLAVWSKNNSPGYKVLNVFIQNFRIKSKKPRQLLIFFALVTKMKLRFANGKPF